MTAKLTTRFQITPPAQERYDNAGELSRLEQHLRSDFPSYSFRVAKGREPRSLTDFVVRCGDKSKGHENIDAIAASIGRFVRERRYLN